MKTLSQFTQESEQLVESKDTDIKALSPDDLKKYLDCAGKFLSKESVAAINWLIEHPDYPKIIGDKSFAEFMNSGVPSNKDLKELYSNVKKVIRNGLTLEFPLFQSDEEFKDIINKKMTVDELVLDLDTEKGRGEVAKKYDSLMWKVANQWLNKSEFSLDDLYGFAAQGLVRAMNTYGKKNMLRPEDEKENVNVSTFLNYAAWCMRNEILNAIRNQGHMVRIPQSVQGRTIAAGEKVTKKNNISIDTPVAKDKEGHTKTIGDKIGDFERAGKDMDNEEIDKMWSAIEKKLKGRLTDREYDVFVSYFGIFGHKKMAPKEIAAKYGLKAQSSVNFLVNKVITAMMQDKALKTALTDIYTMMAECQHDDDLENRDGEPVHISEFLYGTDDDE